MSDTPAKKPAAKKAAAKPAPKVDALEAIITEAGIVPQRFEPAVPIDDLKPHPKNPNRGDLEVIGGSLDENDFFGSVLVQASTGMIIAGEHRWLGQKARGKRHIPAMYLDVDDARALKIMLVDNRAAEMAYRDPDDLASILADLNERDAGIQGTGYTSADLDDLLASIEAPSLDDLADDVGTPNDGDLWPVIRVRVPPALMTRWQAIFDDADGDQPHVKFRSLVDVLERAIERPPG